MPPLEIHLIAIGGTGMAPLACLLKELGHRVRGSDGPLYPPMSTLLAEAGIEPVEGYRAANLQPAPDLVVVGNAVRSDNPEAVAARELGLEQISMPEALARFFLTGRRPLVVAGTHGKTTTSSLAAWVLTDCGRDPGFLIGGVPQNLGRSFAAGRGKVFVVEGDEYNAAYFDRGPKFLHYRPQTAILTSVEYDHADLYGSPEDLLTAYRQMVEIMPPDGLLVACGDEPEVIEIVAGAPCEVVFYGLDSAHAVHPEEIETRAGATHCRVVCGDDEPLALELGVPGLHNLQNALAVWAVARDDGIPGDDIARALARFRGVQRRQQELGTVGGVTVVDDFAHHPTAVAATLPALRQRYGSRRLILVFEPRSLTAGRRMFFDAYREALAGADAAFVAPVFHASRLSDDERLDVEALVAELSDTGTPAATAATVEGLARQVIEFVKTGDVVVTMSSGAFKGLPYRLLESLGSPK